MELENKENVSCIMNLEKKQQIQRLLKYCVSFRDFQLQDKYIDSQDLQSWNIAKINTAFKLHNLLDAIVSKLYEISGRNRKPKLYGLNTNIGLDVLYDEVSHSFLHLKTEIINLEPLYKESKCKHQYDIHKIDVSIRDRFITQITPIELSFLDLSYLIENIIEINQNTICPLIKTIISLK